MRKKGYTNEAKRLYGELDKQLGKLQAPHCYSKQLLNSGAQ